MKRGDNTPPDCKICTHPKRFEINKDILRGMPATKVASKYGDFSDNTVHRHTQNNHINNSLAQALRNKADTDKAKTLLSEMNDLMDRTKSILKKAEDSDSPTIALRAIKELRNNYEFLSKVTIKLEEMRRDDKTQNADERAEFMQKGMEKLELIELKVFNDLLNKIISSNPDYPLHPKTRFYVSEMQRINNSRCAGNPSHDNWHDSPDTSNKGDKYNERKAESGKNGSSVAVVQQNKGNDEIQAKPEQNNDKEPERVNDLDWDDLGSDW